jgi:hypothetical protein
MPLGARCRAESLPSTKLPILHRVRTTAVVACLRNQFDAASDALALLRAKLTLLRWPLQGDGLAADGTWACGLGSALARTPVVDLPALTTSLDVRGRNALAAILAKVLGLGISSAGNGLTLAYAGAEPANLGGLRSHERGSAMFTNTGDWLRLRGHSDRLLTRRFGVPCRGMFAASPRLSRASIIHDFRAVMGFS